MRKITLFALLIGCVLTFSGNISAQKRAMKPATPQQAPTPAPLRPAPNRTVLDFKIGEIFEPVTLRCDDSVYEGEKSLLPGNCVRYPVELDKDGNGSFSIYMGLNYGSRLNTEKPLFATVIANRLEGISWTTRGLTDATEMIQSLEEKFGEPTGRRDFIVENRLGERMRGVSLWWKFSDLSVYYKSIDSRIDEGRVSITTQKADEYIMKGGKKKLPSIL